MQLVKTWLDRGGVDGGRVFRSVRKDGSVVAAVLRRAPARPRCAADISQPPQRVTIRLTHPNACSLPYDDLGLTLRAMLHASGIEPKAPAEAVAPAG